MAAISRHDKDILKAALSIGKRLSFIVLLAIMSVERAADASPALLDVSKWRRLAGVGSSNRSVYQVREESAKSEGVSFG
jgi:hypothetical protein